MGLTLTKVKTVSIKAYAFTQSIPSVSKISVLCACPFSGWHNTFLKQYQWQLSNLWIWCSDYEKEKDNKSFSSWLSASKTQVVTWWHFIYYAAPAPKMDPDLILLWHWEYTVSTAIGLIHDAQTGANWSQNVQKKAQYLQIHRYEQYAQKMHLWHKCAHWTLKMDPRHTKCATVCTECKSI